MMAAVRIVVAPDKFRGTATATEAAQAMGRAASALGHNVVLLPLADGGEGTLEALGGANRRAVVTNPLGDPVEAEYRLSGGTAIIEMARASGLALVGGAEGNDPIAASTHGTGELIAEAAQAGATRVVIGVGGSATTDGGLGAIRALYPPEQLRGVELLVACDVDTLFVDAAEVFGPQKGASKAQVELLRRRLMRLAQVYEEQHGVQVAGLARSGAAGGLAGGLAALGATLTSGFELVADEVELDVALESADLVITGEGGLDPQSFQGKVVGGVVDMAGEFGVKTLVVAGQVDAGFVAPVEVRSLVDEVGDRALSDTAGAIEDVVGAALSGR
jgi:glycerate kinase